MRLGSGFGVVLFLCSAGVSFASEAAKPEAAKPVAQSVDAGQAAGKAAKTAAVAEPAGTAVPTEPVTRTAVPAKPKPKKPARPTLIANIDLSAQRMRVTANGRVVGSWAISSGARGYETPPGKFRPTWAAKMHYSKQYDDAPMPYSVFFNGGIATHGTTSTGRLGRPASHGCVRLKTSNARKFYQLVHRHGYGRTRIIVTGRAKQTRVVARSRQRQESSRRNSFDTPAQSSWGQNYYSQGYGRRYSLSQYDRIRLRRHRERVERYYRSRRRAYRSGRW